MLLLLHTGSRCSGSLAQDVVFVIGTSFAYQSDFNLVKEFVANVTADLIHNSPRSAIGMILFERHAHIEFNLQPYANLSTVLSAISELSRRGTFNDISEALRYFISTVQNGSLRLRRSTSKLVILITSPNINNHRPSALSAATTLHALNMFDVFAIGEYVDRNNLKAIASRPDYAYISRTTDLPQIKNRILSQICNCKSTVNS